MLAVFYNCLIYYHLSSPFQLRKSSVTAILCMNNLEYLFVFEQYVASGNNEGDSTT